MANYDFLRQISVKVNDGSGVIVKPCTDEYCYVFTDWHVIDDEGNVLAFTEDRDVDILYTTPYSSDAIRQEKEEPVYEITLGANITATNYTKEPAIEEIINKNSIILGYYN